MQPARNPQGAINAVAKPKHTRAADPLDELIGRYVGGRYRVRIAKAAILKKASRGARRRSEAKEG